MAEQQGEVRQALPGIGSLVAIASGKGGVGKSTVTVNVALALQAQGLRVGIVDADIGGPTIPLLLGVPDGFQPQTEGQQLLPVERHGIKLISMGMLTGHDQPAVLRGPLVTRYLQAFINEVRWGELDYLLLDLPPGTSDTQLTLAQQMPLTGVVVVTTPQEASLNIARRGTRMFQKVMVPILGLIENMSGFACPHCGEVTDIFKKGGGSELAALLPAPFLGAVPLDAQVVAEGDSGVPVVAVRPESPSAVAFGAIAKALHEQVQASVRAELGEFSWTWLSNDDAPPWHADVVRDDGPSQLPVGLRKADDRTLQVLWADGAEHEIDVRDLRLACPCAVCINEVTGEPMLDPDTVPMDVVPVTIVNTGRYAVSITWSDGHSTGIYTFEGLRRLGELAARRQSFDV